MVAVGRSPNKTIAVSVDTNTVPKLFSGNTIELSQAGCASAFNKKYTVPKFAKPSITPLPSANSIDHPIGLQHVVKTGCNKSKSKNCDHESGKLCISQSPYLKEFKTGIDQSCAHENQYGQKPFCHLEASSSS